MPAKKYSLTDEHRAQLRPWAEKWIANALNCQAMTAYDRQIIRGAMDGIYQAADLPPPTRQVFCAGPISGAIAASVASGVWWLRNNQNQHVALFGHVLSERELMAAIAPACRMALSHKHAATDAATDTAVNAATEAATNAATDVATNAATRAATNIATHAMTDAATEAATDAATEAATDVAVDAATDVATNAATDAATRTATGAATHAMTDAATEAATDVAVDAATDAATYVATNAATYVATDAATEAATHAMTDAATEAATNAAVIRFLVLCCRGWYRMCNGGNQWSGWVAYLSFFRHIAKLPIDYSKWQRYETAAIHGGVRYMHDRFWIVCDRPKHIYRDANNRPHSTEGPFCEFRDGIKLYYVHGVQVPAEWVTQRDTLDPKLALTHGNTEQRRALIALIGWGKILTALNVKEISKDDYGTLLEANIDDDEGQPARFVRVTCPSSGRVYVNRVPPDTKSARHGLTWRFTPPELMKTPTRAAELPEEGYAPGAEA